MKADMTALFYYQSEDESPVLLGTGRVLQVANADVEAANAADDDEVVNADVKVLVGDYTPLCVDLGLWNTTAAHVCKDGHALSVAEWAGLKVYVHSILQTIKRQAGAAALLLKDSPPPIYASSTELSTSLREIHYSIGLADRRSLADIGLPQAPPARPPTSAHTPSASPPPRPSSYSLSSSLPSSLPSSYSLSSSSSSSSSTTLGNAFPASSSSSSSTLAPPYHASVKATVSAHVLYSAETASSASTLPAAAARPHSTNSRRVVKKRDVSVARSDSPRRPSQDSSRRPSASRRAELPSSSSSSSSSLSRQAEWPSSSRQADDARHLQRQQQQQQQQQQQKRKANHGGGGGGGVGGVVGHGPPKRRKKSGKGALRRRQLRMKASTGPMNSREG